MNREVLTLIRRIATGMLVVVGSAVATLAVTHAHAAPLDPPGVALSASNAENDIDAALASGRFGVLELGSDPRMRLRVDGRNYGLFVGGDAHVTRLPLTPGTHVLDFISDEHAFAVRREVSVGAGETKRIVIDLRDHLRKASDPIHASAI